MICKSKKCSREILANDAVFCPYCGRRQVPADRATKSRANGSGTVYRKNGKWIAVVTLGYHLVDGKKKRRTASGTFKTRAEAYDAIPELKKKGGKHNVVLEAAPLKHFHSLYLKSKTYASRSKSQQDKLGYAWERCQPLHDMPMTEITIDDMQDCIDDTVSTFYPARDMKTILSHCYTAAIKREVVPYNKTQYIELPEKNVAKRRAFTEDDKKCFWSDWDAGNRFTGYILIMIYAGVRYGELSTIRLEDIFLDQQYMIGGIKSDAGKERTIPINDRVVPVIKQLCEDRRKKLLEMNEDNFYEKYWDTIDRLKMSRLPPHSCRHTFFTNLATAGVQPAIITTAGGHASYDVTLQYTHIPLKDLIDAANKIE